MIRPSVFANWCLSKLGSYHPTETKRGELSFLMITFQKDDSQVLRKTFLSCKNDKRLGEDFHQRGDALRKGSSGAYYGQEETWLRFNQAKGNIKDLLVNLIDAVWKC